MRSRTVPTPSASSSPAVSGPETGEDRLAVYVHWPFCARKCPYCDFNSHVREQVDEDRFAAALVREIATTAAALPQRIVGSVFFGGGTPSLMPPRVVARVLDVIAAAWHVSDRCEVTLEANPSSAEAGRFAGYRGAGVNRLSLGVQALDDHALGFLGRLHDAATARTALRLACATFPRVSADLIYARPGQTAAAWRAELSHVLGFGLSHLSLYELTIEPGTAFFRRQRGGETMAADEVTAADLYQLTQEMAAAAGLPAYEISNHARPGDECRHNLDCWQGLFYAGIGPGAHGRLPGDGGTVLATSNRRKPESWLKAVEAEGLGRAEAEPLDRLTRARELVLTGLRLVRGIDRCRFRERTGLALEAVIDPAAARRLVARGLLAEDNGHLAATPDGRLVLNALLRALLASDGH
ncbi:MAG: radical SAM family heme chaperone HemW [Rhodothalassiaceae bacterium]